jgi:hypothetical protein
VRRARPSPFPCVSAGGALVPARAAPNARGGAPAVRGRACASVSAGGAAFSLAARTAEEAWRCRCASHTRAWGAFSGLRGRRRELSVAPGRTAGGGGGFSERWAAPKGFFYVVSVQSPGRSRTAARPVRGEGEACVSSRGAGGLSLPCCSLALLALAYACGLRVDLDLTGLQQLRRRGEALLLKRCRALSSAHDNASLATTEQ